MKMELWRPLVWSMDELRKQLQRVGKAHLDLVTYTSQVHWNRRGTVTIVIVSSNFGISVGVAKKGPNEEEDQNLAIAIGIARALEGPCLQIPPQVNKTNYGSTRNFDPNYFHSVSWGGDEWYGGNSNESKMSVRTVSKDTRVGESEGD